MTPLTETIYTVGCSTHTAERFIELLRQHAIAALADVRSVPYSRFTPQFNREPLTVALKQAGIEYLYFGKELGARADDPRCHENGKVRYERLAATEPFRQGLDRVRQEARTRRVALMCAEKDPLQCHRAILVSRKLDEAGVQVVHILEDGTAETHSHVLTRLLEALDIPEYDLFRTREEAIEDAYRIQGEAISYSAETEEEPNPEAWP